jgi:hypothetical protein
MDADYAAKREENKMPKKSWFSGFFVLLLVLVLLPQPAATQAQDGGTASAGAGIGLSNFVLAQFSNYLGISPVLTASEVELGANRPFDVSYRFNGLDLRTDPLSCDSRVMTDDEIITNGLVGYRYLITLQGRTYEFRTDAAGKQLIRCYFGEAIDFNGTPRGVGALITGEQATNAAMQHASTYLGLESVVTIEKIEADAEDIPFSNWRWDSFVYLDASLNCPAANTTYDVRDTFAFRVQLTIGGRYLDYRVRGDGQQIILCRGGRPDASSIGLTTGQISTQNDTTTTTN